MNIFCTYDLTDLSTGKKKKKKQKLVLKNKKQLLRDPLFIT